MDYGHELLFGTFITPAAQRPHHAVELAVVADRAGLDLLTFQDHPYQPGFLDTWTLLTYVAARTSRVRLSHNVVHLPLRPPVMLARAAASVDLLSGGRFELGIGAGRMWDATKAMGGPHRSPGEAVEALEEAITIIREVWAADKPGGVFFDGKHYRAWGAPRGPAPAHDVGIWVGAGMLGGQFPSSRSWWGTRPRTCWPSPASHPAIGTSSGRPTRWNDCTRRSSAAPTWWGVPEPGGASTAGRGRAGQSP
jgi:alkanesulfonate monooxygenase SsuD/methylene tetrahydromethanopterin reductase-like flavin-dependent oxidoreductase (luciferase family)